MRKQLICKLKAIPHIKVQYASWVALVNTILFSAYHFFGCHYTLFILKWKKCQTNPPGTLNVFYILVIHTDNAKVSFVLIELCQPSGVACRS